MADESQLESIARSSSMVALRRITAFRNNYDPEFDDFIALELRKTGKHPLYGVLPRMHLDHHRNNAPNPMTFDENKVPPLDAEAQEGLFNYILQRYYESAAATYLQESVEGRNHQAAFALALQPLNRLGDALATAMGNTRFPDNFQAPPDLLDSYKYFFKIGEDLAKAQPKA